MYQCKANLNFKAAIRRDEYSDMQSNKKRHKMAPLQQVPGVTYDDDEQSKLAELFQQLDFCDIIADSPRVLCQKKRGQEEKNAPEKKIEPCSKRCRNLPQSKGTNQEEEMEF